MSSSFVNDLRVQIERRLMHDLDGPPGRPASRLDAEWVRREARSVVDAGERIRSYDGFLNDSREAKTRGLWSLSREREVADRARLALNDFHDLAHGALSLFRHAQNQGVLRIAFECIRSALGETRAMTSDELWSAIQDRSLEALGISDATRDSMGHLAKELAQTYEVDGDTLRIRTARTSYDIRLSIPAPATERLSVIAAALGSDLDSVLAFMEDPGSCALGVRLESPTEERPRVRDASHSFGTLLMLAQRELARHAQKLEDVGLATHMGDEPGTIFVITAVVAVASSVAIAASLVLLIDCQASGHEDSCAHALSLLLFGFAGLGVVVGSTYLAIGLSLMEVYEALHQ